MTEPPYAAPPLELKLFPEVASAEGREPCEDQDAPSHVARPQARYPTQSASWPVSLFSGLPRMEDEQCSSSTTGSSKEASTDREWVDQLRLSRSFCFEPSGCTDSTSCVHVNMNLLFGSQNDRLYSKGRLDLFILEKLKST
jgi:hypothetical protein